MTEKQKKQLEFYIEKALEEAENSDIDVRIGACLFSSTGLWITGTNYRSIVYSSKPYLNSLLAELEFSTHAEIVCVLRAIGRGINFNIGDWSIVVASKRADGTYRNTEPCRICKRVLKLVGVDTVYFYEDGSLTSLNLSKG